MDDTALAMTEPYGDVAYADPGYRDGRKRYPINTKPHIRAAWAYINMPKNSAKYTGEQLRLIKDRIKTAAARNGIEIADDNAYSGTGTVGLAYPDKTSLLASAGPIAPPATWFSNPQLAAPTKLTITEDGRIFGHLAQWRRCHVGIGNACVVAPKSRTAYNLFKIGSVVCEDGSQFAIGKIVMGSAHANAQYGVMPARDFYDNTSMTAALVNIGEDQHGIWISGALTASMSPEKIVELRASALSGDWRMYEGNMELIAALAVNSPGFPIYRASGGQAFSMMAVGVVGQDDDEELGEFSMTGDENTEFTAPPTGIAEEQQERASKLNELSSAWTEKQQERRMTELAALTEGREALSDSYPRARDEFTIHAERSKKFKMLPESLHADMNTE